MGLKKELTLSFGGLTLVMLLAFGVITYFTFSETMSSSRSTVFELNARESTRSIAALLNRQVEILRHQVEILFLQYQGGSISPEEFRRQLSEKVDTDGVLGELYLVTPQTMELLASTGKLAEKEIHRLYAAARLDEMAPGKGLLIKDALGVYFVWCLDPSASAKDTVCVLSVVRMGEFESLVRQWLSTEGGSLVAHRAGDVLLRIDKSLSEFSDKAFDEVLGFHGDPDRNMRELEEHFLVTAPQGLFGWDLSYALPKNLFYSDLDRLKNRIIAAVVLIWWVTLWAIMIFAHRITGPISSLSRGCKDIIDLNYETPLAVKSSSEEVVALTRAFESMRTRIKDQVAKDQLTDVYNRRYLMQILETSVSKAKRLDEDLSCLMIDVDYFKKVNDTYGHSGGDEVLKAMGQVLKAMTRDYDVVARYGGEEFTVILPATAEDVAYTVAERFRMAMLEQVTVHEDKEIRCTVSIGLASLANRPETAGKLIEMADEALYLAKQGGRNRTEVFAG